MITLDDTQGIAIVGMAGRFPKAPELHSFWRLLRDGIDGITHFSVQELLGAGVPRAVAEDPAYVRARGIIAQDDSFDAALFGMGAHEAERTDPQQRVWLECALAALEDAGCNPRTYSGLVGVFAGVGSSNYLQQWLASKGEQATDYQLLLGNDKDCLATRTSYKLGLRGPSLSVQTACSTSLVAVWLACQQLLGQQCDLAIAGGVSLSIPSRAGYWYREGMIFSPDGRCRAFDARARGTVPGDGVGAIVLKRLPEALADGDDIYAVIRGAAVNNDGDTKVGYTAPSVTGQREVILQALAYAGVSPPDVSFVEAHGTGTVMGDPIEFAALRQVFAEGGAQRGACALGAVKTNIGHLDVAAGVAGLIKTVLALRHRAIPPMLGFDQPNPELDLDNSPFYINRTLRPWAPAGPLIAGVSSFGIGGTNAHVILSEAPARPRSPSPRRVELFPLSAATPQAVARLAGELATHLARERPPVGPVAYTLQTGRIARAYRYAVVANDVEQAVDQLQHCKSPSQAPDVPPQLALLFPGQGAQTPGMASALALAEPQVGEELRRADAVMHTELGVSLMSILNERHAITETHLTQPVLFAVEYALAQVLRRWGLGTGAMLGHSLGEYVAACLAEVFSFEQALSLLAERGRLMQDSLPGAMMAVPLAETEVLPLLGSKLDLAAVNGPAQCVVSGAETDIDRLAQALTARGISGHRLRTTRAFHSRLMDGVLERFTQRLGRVPFRTPKAAFLSCLTGDWITPHQATAPDYWARQLRGTVRFDAALAKLLARASLLIEVGPGDMLGSLARRHPGRPKELTVLTTLGRSSETANEPERWLAMVGAAWCAGAKVDWSAMAGSIERAHLPTYPFERQRYWGLAAGTLPSQASPGAGAAPAQAISHRMPGWLYAPVWRTAPKRGTGQVPKRWLVFADRAGVAEPLARRLGENTTLVHIGDTFARLDSRRFTIAPASRDDFAAVFDALQDEPIDGIVHAFALDTVPGLDELDAALARGYLSVVALAQAMGRAKLRGPQLTLLTAGAQAAQAAPTHPTAAMLCGLMRVLPAEYPDFAFRHIDLASHELCRSDVAEMIHAELGASFASPEVALRAGERLVCTYEPMEELRDPSMPMLRQGGVYLVTGGLGGIGITLAEHLAVTYGARLILTGRSGLPEESEWPRILGRVKDDEARLRLEKYLRVRATAGGLIVKAADIADVQQARALVALALTHFGTLDGVIHAAGVTGGGALQRRPVDGGSDILRAKVHGTLALDAALVDIPIRFFLLCSSLTAITGGFGQADYAAANAFLDAYAESTHRPGERLVLSINWDGWREVGAAARYAAQGGAMMPPELHPLLDGWDSEARGGAYRTELDDQRWIVREHRVRGVATVPGTAYLELACAVARAHGLAFPFTVRELALLSPCALLPGERTVLYTSVHKKEGVLEIQTASCDTSGQWRLHATARIAPGQGNASRQAIDPALFEPPADPCDLDAPARIRTGYIEVGPRWNCRDWLHSQGEQTVGHFQLAAEFAQEAALFTLHPALFDALTSVVETKDPRDFLPFSYSNMTVYEALADEVYVLATADTSSGALHARLLIAGKSGQLLLSIEDYTLRPVPPQERA